MSLKRLLRRVSASLPSPSTNLQRRGATHGGADELRQLLSCGVAMHGRTEQLAAVEMGNAEGPPLCSPTPPTRASVRQLRMTSANSTPQVAKHWFSAGCSLCQVGEEGAYGVGGGAQLGLIVSNQLQAG